MSLFALIKEILPYLNLVGAAILAAYKVLSLRRSKQAKAASDVSIAKIKEKSERAATTMQAEKSLREELRREASELRAAARQLDTDYTKVLRRNRELEQDLFETRMRLKRYEPDLSLDQAD
ncbi:MAG: hypothetical protein WBV94_21640 [Blastocatellia bacterium]